MIRSLHTLPAAAATSSSAASISRPKFLSASNTSKPLRLTFPFESLSTPTISSRLRFGTPRLRCPVSVGKDRELRITKEEGEGDRGGGGEFTEEEQVEGNFKVGIRNPSIGHSIGRFQMGLGDQAFLLFTFVALTTSISFCSLVIATVPTLYAMRRTAISLAKLADTAREELPSTMSAIRLSGMDINDLTLELSELSQEITEGVTKSAQIVQVAEAGIRQMGALAKHKTMSMIEERGNLPDISLKPLVTGAARKTIHGLAEARKTFMHIISKPNSDSENLDNVDNG